MAGVGNGRQVLGHRRGGQERLRLVQQTAWRPQQEHRRTHLSTIEAGRPEDIPKVGGRCGARGTRPQIGRHAAKIPAHVALEMRIPGARARERRMGSPELEIRRLGRERPIETRQRRPEHGGGVRLEVHTLRQCLRQAPIAQHKPAHPLGVIERRAEDDHRRARRPYCQLSVVI